MTRSTEAPRRPSGPRGAGALGLLLGPLAEFSRDKLGFFLSALREHGDFVPMRLGHKRIFLVSHPEWIRTVLQDRYRSFDKASPAYKQLRFVLRDGLLTSEGEHWRRQRKLAQPAFHRERVRSFTQVMTREAARLGESWRRRAGETVDVADEMMRVTLRIVGETLFGADLSSQAEQVARAVPELLEQLNRRVLSPVRVPLAVPTARNRRFTRALGALDGAVGSILEERRRACARGEGRGPGGDLLDMLLAARDESTGEGMSDAQLRDEALTFLLAGHETTAIALTWAFYLLGRHPGAAEALAGELAAVLGGRSPTYEDVPKLVYTRAVLMEATRLYPPVWMVSRRALEDVPIGPYVVPKGGIVLVCPYVLHRSERLWSEPEAFRPERFLPGSEERIERFAFLGFGGGPRVCIGAQFAQVEGVVLLAELLQRVALRLAPGARVEPSSNMSLRPRFGMPMRIGVAGG